MASGCWVSFMLELVYAAMLDLAYAAMLGLVLLLIFGKVALYERRRAKGQQNAQKFGAIFGRYAQHWCPVKVHSNLLVCLGDMHRGRLL